MSCQYIKYVMIFFWKYSILHKKFKKDATYCVSTFRIIKK